MNLELFYYAQGGVMLAVTVALITLKAYAFILALTFPAEGYIAADKLTKPAWLAILGIGLVVELLGLLAILNIVFTIAAIVFLVDVRPAIRGLRRS
ncbi:DUF2516 family protein [Nocardioides sp. CFH 31398]|uniref:DUF2516 family protein n=1 Tax=Nocardioides sp. CFH 31398 TaxID=2919579 RepID=UPI001F05FB5C|nr:DUF2516 family protein [Nocardioides sp. CFH 31398]MCH1865982.1 DUF2516 family protein [Nocardioides sp. CFH 31398]